MIRDHRSSDPLPFDPFSARNLAMVCALVGLVTLLISERPTPGGVLLAWGGLVGWALLRVFGRAPQPVRKRPRRRPMPVVEILEPEEWAPRRPAPALALPKPIALPKGMTAPEPVAAPEVAAWKTPAHPAVLAGVRRRREEG
ncbi:MULTISPECIES: hypothetical protein [Methylobacterium]|jgi:hypothetical protein|uniref:hypothetical protein n=1 Tax=Methylobacterium TaxID=407 RepID=UPI0008F1A98D|nr:MULTISPECIES: hypothetical protein [Methylobacterium]MBK3400343.1 hypothetical protein [Methylobacterium ajmalii]MBK3411925.1 hypothetical protein [Methylobacterium ajmalii]MBZ6417075.1 hypothetical protein [Methylobacterium sp.]SFF47130.1 hypothetical protein SAMN04487844_12133 [Methylobacterium sp. yr596]